MATLGLPEEPAYVLGRAAGNGLLSGLLAGILPHRARARWNWAGYLGVTVDATLILSFLQSYGARNGG